MAPGRANGLHVVVVGDGVRVPFLRGGVQHSIPVLSLYNCNTCKKQQHQHHHSKVEIVMLDRNMIFYLYNSLRDGQPRMARRSFVYIQYLPLRNETRSTTWSASSSTPRTRRSRSEGHARLTATVRKHFITPFPKGMYLVLSTTGNLSIPLVLDEMRPCRWSRRCPRCSFQS